MLALTRGRGDHGLPGGAMLRRLTWFGRWRLMVAAGGAGALVLVACTSAGASDVTRRSTGVSPAPRSTTATTSATSTAADWATYDRNAGRSGVSTSSPAPGKVRKSWTAKVDGAVYAQPLILGSEVIIATENDSVYALNAGNGKVRWSRHLASPVTGGLPCGNIDPSGITGTPVADIATGTLWVVTFTSKPAYRHTLWELNTKTGKIVRQRTIDAPGSDPRAQQERGALALLGSRVYVPYGGLFGDCSDYKGRVVGAPLSGSGKLVSFTTPTQVQAGIWVPAGETVSGDSMYVATGNGTPFAAIDDSDSVLRLGPELAVQGRFTPSNFEELSANDLDLGSTNPALLPGGLIFMVGKQGVGYVLNGARLGGTGGQLASAQVCEGGFGGDAVDGSTVVFSCFNSLRAIQVSPGNHGAAPKISTRWSVPGIGAGPPIIAGGVVWDVSRGDTLSGYRLSNGAQVFSVATAPVVTSFPSLSASGSRLVVPEGYMVVSYVGI
jgi:polyvinyl alcohol dehydrogenase (cytochrome)